MPRAKKVKVSYWGWVNEYMRQNNVDKPTAQAAYSQKMGKKSSNGKHSKSNGEMPVVSATSAGSHINSPDDIFGLADKKAEELTEIISTTKESLTQMEEQLVRWNKIKESAQQS